MSLHYCVTKQWSYRKKRSTQLLIGWLTRPLPGCWEVIGRDRGGGAPTRVGGGGGGVLILFTRKAILRAPNDMIVRWGGGGRLGGRGGGRGALGPTSYQENGAKETEAGDRKLEEEAAPIVPAQQCSYGNRQRGGKSAERPRV